MSIPALDRPSAASRALRGPGPASGRRRGGRLAPWLLGALALLLPACGEEARTAEPLAPVLLIGVDGLEWDVLGPMIAEGRCPNLRALCERGSYGVLGTFVPTWSPVVWTSIATGKRMEEHGITGFVDAENQAFTSSRRDGRALWNIADRYGLTSNVFGWWITWPVEEVRGVMVSGTSASAQLTHNWKPALAEEVADQVHPPELEARVLALAAEAGSAEAVAAVAREKVFRGLAGGVELADWEKRLVDQTMWSVQSDATFFRIAADLLPDHPADLSMVYFGGPDVSGHRFWRHAFPEQFEYGGSSPEVDAALAPVLTDYYAWVDEMIGELVAIVGEGTTVFVVSDHGMHAVATKARDPSGNTGNHQDGTPGVLVAAGPGILRQDEDLDAAVTSGALRIHGSVTAVPPTILGLLGIPAARDMASRPYRNFLTEEARQKLEALELVPTHDDGFRAPQHDLLPESVNADFKQRMSELAYLGLEAPEQSAPVDPRPFLEQDDGPGSGGDGDG